MVRAYIALSLQALADIFVSIISIMVSYYSFKAYLISKRRDLALISIGFTLYSSALAIRGLLLLVQVLASPFRPMTLLALKGMLSIAVPIAYTLIAVGYTLNALSPGIVTCMALLPATLAGGVHGYRHELAEAVRLITLDRISELISTLVLLYTVMIMALSGYAGESRRVEPLLAFTLILLSHVVSLMAIPLVSVAAALLSSILRVLGFAIILVSFLRLARGR